jgi:hypothetical protein
VQSGIGSGGSMDLRVLALMKVLMRAASWCVGLGAGSGVS